MSSKLRAFLRPVLYFSTIFALLLVLHLSAKDAQTSSTLSPTSEDVDKRPSPPPLVVHPEHDAEIARIVGALLERRHYLNTPITPEMSQRWIGLYLTSLDPLHQFFLKSDVDEFTTKYGNRLGDLLLHNDNVSDEAAIAPAFEIFSRYMQRVKEKISLVDQLVHQKYDFNAKEMYTLPSEKAAWSVDAASAQAQWQGLIKSDFLGFILRDKAKDLKIAGRPGSSVSMASTGADSSSELITEKMIRQEVKRYHSILRGREELEDMDVLGIYLDALCHAYDPHSDYLLPDDSASFTMMALNLQVTGIGAVLRDDDGYATIEDVMVGGPADKDKRLQAGDRIVAVGQDSNEPVDAVNMRLNKVVDMIRGKKGSTVRLIIIPAGSKDTTIHKEIVLKRDVVQIKDSAAKANVIEHANEDGTKIRLGVIDLHGFYQYTARDIGKLLVRLRSENVSGIILDMRNNGGGLLDQAIDLSGLFVKHEPVVQSRDSNGSIEVYRTGDVHQVWAGPLLAMVNKNSASATEIVSAALQDYGRAVIVGDKSTHGKGTVQTLMPINQFTRDPKVDSGTLKITVQKFYRISGGSTQEKGVVPDIILPSPLDAIQLGETTLPYYLRYDTIDPVPFDFYNKVSQNLSTLLKDSQARVAKSQDFAYLKADIAINKDKFGEKPISLNLQDRLQDLVTQIQHRTEEKKDLVARKNSRDKVLELTLDMVDQNLPLAAPAIKPKSKFHSLDPDAENDDDDDSLTIDPTTLSYDPQLSESVNIMSEYIRMLDASGAHVANGK